MIRNFEEYTDQLTDDEITWFMPRLTKLLILAIGKDNAITNKEILHEINVVNPVCIHDVTAGTKKFLKTREARIRHMVHILRVSDTIPFLVATAVGYFISNDKEEIESYIGSIDDRLRSIYQIRRALKRQVKEWGHYHEAIQGQLVF